MTFPRVLLEYKMGEQLVSLSQMKPRTTPENRKWRRVWKRALMRSFPCFWAASAQESEPSCSPPPPSTGDGGRFHFLRPKRPSLLHSVLYLCSQLSATSNCVSPAVTQWRWSAALILPYVTKTVKTSFWNDFSSKALKWFWESRYFKRPFSWDKNWVWRLGWGSWSRETTFTPKGDALPERVS